MLKLGWVPNSSDYSHPADRRKLLFYLKKVKTNIVYEVAQYDIHYDILYVSLRSDLTLWSKYRKKQLARGAKTWIIFDLSDSYLLSEKISDVLRPIYHYIIRRCSSLRFSYKNILIEMINNSDVVICGSIEQQLILKEHHENVRIVRDYFLDDIRSVKKDYNLAKGGELHILWEGFSHGNKKIFRMIRGIVHRWGLEKNNYRINLHFLTDPLYCTYGASTFCRSTYTMLKNIFTNVKCGIDVYSWNPATFSSIATACDFAIIPIPNDSVMWYKPENKLLLLWSLGIPVLATPTPAYKRVMSEELMRYLCNDLEAWSANIARMAFASENRQEYMQFANKYLAKHCNDKAILSMWKEVMSGCDQIVYS